MERRKRRDEGKGERKKEREKKVKRYLSHELRKKSMSTAVNYDKCRECDAAISRYHQRCADYAAERVTFKPRRPSRSMGRMPYIQRLANCGLSLGRKQLPADIVHRTRDSKEVTTD